LAKALFAILLDGGFLTKKIQAHYKRAATAADVVAYCDQLKAYLVTLAHSGIRPDLKAHADFVINDPYSP
jgi:hypothetical protein